MAGLTIQQQLAKVQERKEKLEARLEQKMVLEAKKKALAEIREKKKLSSDKEKRVKLVGEFVLSLLGDDKVRDWLVKGLDGHLTAPEDRRLFPELPQEGAV